MRDKKPPNRKARIKAMFVTGTEGLQPYINAQSHYSEDFKNFLNGCLEMQPEKRALPEQLIQVSISIYLYLYIYIFISLKTKNIWILIPFFFSVAYLYQKSRTSEKDGKCIERNLFK